MNGPSSGSTGATGSAEVPELLRLTVVDEHVYRVNHPAESTEGRDVVFSGQLLAQMIMASDASAGGAKDVRSIHAVFARAGSYSTPIDLRVDSMQSGRTWASDTVTAEQEGRLVSRAIVLLNTVDADLVRHGPALPESVPAPEDCEPGAFLAFPGSEVRPVPGEAEDSGVPVEMEWLRHPRAVGGPAANQAVLAWATCGHVIGLAMRPHRDRIQISDAHRSLSTGVIAQTVHFLERFDVADWLLLVTRADSAAAGRVYGTGTVFTRDGRAVAVFHQDSMLKAAGAPLDPSRSL